MKEERDNASGKSKGVTGGNTKGKDEVSSGKDNSGRSKEGGGSNGKEGASGSKGTVKSFIIDDTPSSRTLRAKVSAPPPPLPIRLVSTEDKSSKPPLAEYATAGAGSLNYIDIDINNDDSNSTSTGSAGTNSTAAGAFISVASKNSSTSPVPVEPQIAKQISTVDYTTLDPEKTLELAKKNSNIH